jgi:carboxylate-amine ligase
MRRDNVTWRIYSSDLIDENKWRAVRYGLTGKLIDFGKEVELPAPVLIREFLEWFLADVLDELGSRQQVEYAFRILQEGSSADRQVATFRRTGSLKAVVDQLIAETEEGVFTKVAPELRVDARHPTRAVSELRYAATTGEHPAAEMGA